MLGVAVALMPLPARTATPWGYDAHRLVCDIAWREMTPTARTAAGELLGADRPEERFNDACVWADRIRNDTAYGRYTSAHYMNVPPGHAHVDPAVDCADSYCVLDAIRDLTADLRDRSLPSARRRDALRLLIHLVADVHQPLHVGRLADRGGNDVPVRFFDEATNLHMVWDVGLVRRAMLDRRDGLRLYESITPAERAAWDDPDPVTWANESYRIVERDVYRGVEPGVRLGEAYANRNAAIVELRLVQAGYRVGLLLNRVLGSDRLPSRN